MRVVVTGASGNVGTSLLSALAEDDEVTSVLGLARRVPAARFAKVDWSAADVTTADLLPFFRGADAVVHLAWLIQPSRDQRLTEKVNVAGSERVFRAVAEAGVRRLVYASSVGAYSPGSKHRLVDESHPTEGVPTSFYSRHKAAVERMLDRFESDHPAMQVARLRPALIFKGDAAAGIRRLFAGPLLPNALVRRGLIAIVPAVRDLRFQAVHSLDAGEAYRLAIKSEAGGAFNLAAEPVLDSARLEQLLDARRVRISPTLLRSATKWSWRLHLQPTPAGWLDMALQVPLMDSGRAREELGWAPRFSSEEALLELLDGLRDGRGLPTPPLHPTTGGRLRIREFLTGVGARS
jgi:nucleoside-diphosphate-sugar epimerase